VPIESDVHFVADNTVNERETILYTIAAHDDFAANGLELGALVGVDRPREERRIADGVVVDVDSRHFFDAFRRSARLSGLDGCGAIRITHGVIL
jgi:hypothetical protein